MVSPVPRGPPTAGDTCDSGLAPEHPDRFLTNILLGGNESFFQIQFNFARTDFRKRCFLILKCVFATFCQTAFRLTLCPLSSPGCCPQQQRDSFSW
jgi:hypothetical protein